MGMNGQYFQDIMEGLDPPQLLSILTIFCFKESDSLEKELDGLNLDHMPGPFLGLGWVPGLAFPLREYPTGEAQSPKVNPRSC